jgi:uncharacterized repeat protein (TIGR01451 family)
VFRQSQRHLYHLKEYLQSAGLAIVSVVWVNGASAASLPQLFNQAQYQFDTVGTGSSGTIVDTVKPGDKDPFTGQPLGVNVFSNTNRLISNPKLIDPLGGITGCNGEILSSYEGFTVSLYDTPDRLRLGNLLTLAPTEFPDIQNNGIPLGIAPNIQNSNPFALTTGNPNGQYNFSLNVNAGQLNPGRTYILVIKPPSGSNYAERQILLEVQSSTDTSVSFRVRTLDNQILGLTANNQVTDRVIVTPREDISPSLALVGLNVGVCNPSTFQIIKSADRAAAEPGDTVVYRLVIKNLSTVPVNNLVVTDTLPLGFRIQPNAVKAKQGSTDLPVSVSQSSGNVVTLGLGSLPPSGTINVAYATTLTPDAIRGTGSNSALLRGNRGDNGNQITDGPAIYQLQVRQGIVADTGTIIGRVFVDKNFDGEQQPNEPGIPNAVVFLDDGNKITTDANGMFSVKGAANGYRTGVLDLSSLPGYTLAPNLYFKERNSQSRLVKLAPSGLVRMNFGVTPTAREAK